MTNLRKKHFVIQVLHYFVSLVSQYFFSYRSTQNSSTTVSSNRNYDRASLIHPSYAPSIRRNSKYHDVIDTFKTITGYISIINNAFPRLQILILFNNFLTEKIPDAITINTRMREIILDRNILTGPLSTEISSRT